MEANWKNYIYWVFSQVGEKKSNGMITNKPVQTNVQSHTNYLELRFNYMI